MKRQDWATSFGQLADCALLSDDYFTVSDDEIINLTSVMTVLGGRIVHADGDFASLAPPSPPALPDWSPVNHFGGYQSRFRHGRDEMRADAAERMASACGCASACGVHGHAHASAWSKAQPVSDAKAFWGALGCACWAF